MYELGRAASIPVLHAQPHSRSPKTAIERKQPAHHYLSKLTPRQLEQRVGKTVKRLERGELLMSMVSPNLLPSLHEARAVGIAWAEKNGVTRLFVETPAD